jgi:dimeric dUTPase (all-alpha-NTP-PPase superfamily)
MREIFDRQWQLNIHTLANIGKDFEKTIADPEQKVVWIENYRKALSAELAELIREVEEYGIGTRNGKIEIVDIMHFLVSLSQIVHIQPEEIPSFSITENGTSFESCAIRTFLGLDALQNSLKWKWWAKGGGYKPEKARDAILDLWKSIAVTCAVFAFDFEELKRVYIEKNKVNFQRQNLNYNEDTKTEADNLAIRI